MGILRDMADKVGQHMVEKSTENAAWAVASAGSVHDDFGEIKDNFDENFAQFSSLQAEAQLNHSNAVDQFKDTHATQLALLKDDAGLTAAKDSLAELQAALVQFDADNGTDLAEVVSQLDESYSTYVAFFGEYADYTTHFDQSGGNGGGGVA